MVVIVIRAQPKDSGEEIYSARMYSVENPPRVFASSRMPETYDERDCFNESWPSSPDLVLDAKLRSGDYECVNGNRAFCNRSPERVCWDALEQGFVGAGSKGLSTEQRARDFRLDSPLSKDSGYCDRVTPCRTKRTTYFKVPETCERFDRKARLPFSTTFAEGSRYDAENNVAYLSSSSQVDPEDSIATTKEEEWVTKKKIELTTTRQIETRVKRQVVLEDGKVVEDSGPMVTTNTTEDTEKQEHSQTEHRTLGDDDPEERWISLPNPSGCVKEVQEKTVRSREETEERTEMENVQHLGDFSDEGYMMAVKSNSDDFRQALEVSNKKEVVESGPKIIHQSLRTRKYIDTEDKTERSQVEPGGKLVNETRTTRLHEEYGNYNLSDDESSTSASLYETSKKENSQRYRRTKEQDLTEYLANGQKIGEKFHHQAETTEGERHGDAFNFDKEMESLPSKLKRIKLRAQNHRLAVENPDEQKDILSKKSLSYDQEEQTRKAETSKWLEHHFGSESTKSSKGSLEDLDDIVPSTQSSFISVTMKSQPLKKTSRVPSGTERGKRATPERAITTPSSDSERPIKSPELAAHFQGMSVWSTSRKENIDAIERSSNSHNNTRAYSPPPLKQHKNRNYFISTPLTETTNNDLCSPVTERMTRFRTIPDKNKSYEYHDGRCRTPSSYQHTSYEINSPSPPLRKKQKDVGGSNEVPFEGRLIKDRRKLNEEISFEHENQWDSAACRSSTPKDEDITAYQMPGNKKLYQRTRFAADIPPPPQPRPEPVKHKSKIGESLKKFVGKLRSSSQDRRNKKKTKAYGSRSPSPRENTYQNYNSLDNYGSVVDRGGEEIEEPIAPPRGKYNGNVHSRVPGKTDKLLHRYYLGEDPFSASIYGREREYEENTHKTIKNGKTESDTEPENDFKSRTLGRFSKSTSRLINSGIPKSSYSRNGRGVQTLPRKLRDESIPKKPVAYKNFQEPLPKKAFTTNQWKSSEFGYETREPLDHTGSMINVSIVNQPYSAPATTDIYARPNTSLNGPAKPARTYRSNLSRSQSFSVQPGERNYSSANSRDPYKSNPHLHRLEEVQAPLESPGIISGWSQGSKQANEQSAKDKRRLFMKGLYDRAPELFETLHGDNLDEIQTFKNEKNRINYSNSFRSTSTVNTNSSLDVSNPHYDRFNRDKYLRSSRSPVFTETYFDEGNLIKTVSRSESSGNDDYSETVRIKSKSGDPLNPSETDTVKTFTKKKIPLKNGLATETVESSETKTIQKSQNLRGGLESNNSVYSTNPGGIVIKVRNRN